MSQGEVSVTVQFLATNVFFENVTVWAGGVEPPDTAVKVRVLGVVEKARSSDGSRSHTAMMGTMRAIAMTVLSDCIMCRPCCCASRVSRGILLRCSLLLKLCLSKRCATVGG